MAQPSLLTIPCPPLLTSLGVARGRYAKGEDGAPSVTYLTCVSAGGGQLYSLPRASFLIVELRRLLGDDGLDARALLQTLPYVGRLPHEQLLAAAPTPRAPAQSSPAPSPPAAAPSAPASAPRPAMPPPRALEAAGGWMAAGARCWWPDTAAGGVAAPGCVAAGCTPMALGGASGCAPLIRRT